MNSLLCKIKAEYYIRYGSNKSFRLSGCIYDYFHHEYNATWNNERAVEVAVIWEIIKKYQGKRILEVGNVLSHYYPVVHDIIDKFEQAPGVLNVDVIDFQPHAKYDLIVSISTLEHVGWDEEPKDPLKIIFAIKNLESILVPGGQMVVTLPMGYNHEMDRLFREKQIKFTKHHYLKRISEDNKWMEVGWKEIQDAKYDYPFPFANALVIGILEKI